MKFKNIFHQVTYKILMKNKTRTIVTMIGIVLSTALITAIATFVSSLQNSMMEFKISERGNWHVAVQAIPEQPAAGLQKSSQVAFSSALYSMGYADLQKNLDSKQPASRILVEVLAGEPSFYETITLELTNGRMPQNAAEIILPAELAAKFPENVLGAELELGLGVRIGAGGKEIKANTWDTTDGTRINLEEEQLRTEKTAVYTVVGVYKSASTFTDGTPAYPALTCYDGENKGYGANIYVRLKNTNDAYNAFMEEYAKTYPVIYNSGLLKMHGSSAYTGYYSFVYAMATIVIVLVMAGSILVIFNSFAISLSERMKQFGLLSSIGATKAQLRRSVFFEAAFVSVIGIPVGILLGIGGIGATLFLIRSRLRRMAASMVSLGEMNLSVSWTAVLVAVLAAVITVMIASFIPMVRISRMSAIDVIRQKQDVVLKAKKMRTGRIAYRLFGLEGMLAKKNFKRSKKKYRTTVISLFVSIVLFIAAVSFGDYLVQSVEGIYKVGAYEIKYTQYPQEGTPSSSVLEAMKQAESVTQAGTANVLYTQLDPVNDNFTPAYQAYCNANNEEETQENGVSARLYGIEDTVYRAYLKEQGLSQAVYMDADKPQFVAFAKHRSMDPKTGKVTMTDIFNNAPVPVRLAFSDAQKYRELSKQYADQLVLEPNHTDADYQAYRRLTEWISEQSRFAVDATIGCFTEELPYTIDTSSRYDGIILICPMSALEKLVDLSRIDGWAQRTFFKTSNHEKAFEELKEILKGHNLVFDRALVDEAMEYESTQSTVFVVRVFAGGFIVLMSLIAVANVFNTMSTNMMLRRREFAMLKTIGMTNRGFDRMLYYECILYGSKALLYGIPVALLFTWWIYKSVSDLWSTGYQVPWAAILVAVVSVFAVVLSTMMYCKRKINRMNMLDVIKDENI